jgi:hypothetical protein
MAEIFQFESAATRAARLAALHSIALVQRYQMAGLMAPEFAQEIEELMRARLARLAAGGHP